MTTSNSFRHRHAVRSQPAPLVKRPGQYRSTRPTPPTAPVQVRAFLQTTSGIFCSDFHDDIYVDAVLTSPDHYVADLGDFVGHSMRVNIFLNYAVPRIETGYELNCNDGAGWHAECYALDTVWAGQNVYTGGRNGWTPLTSVVAGNCSVTLNLP